MATQGLPEDVMFHILLWLPVISLLRFKSVCKSWCAHIDSSTFITQHIHHHNHHNNKNGIIIVKSVLKPEFCLLSGELYKERVNLDLGAFLPMNTRFSSKESWWNLNLVASCNGIICLSCKTNVKGVALWNPATKQLTRLRSEAVSLYMGCNRVYFGFGYDVKADDYKVIMVERFLKSEYSVAYNRVEVYSLQTDSWRTVNDNLGAHFMIGYSGGVGACDGQFFCWLLENCSDEFIGYSSILYFDFRTEIFGTTPLPYLRSTGMGRSILSLIGDNITFIHSMSDHFDIWVLKEFGVKESWTKLSTVGPFRLLGKAVLIPRWFLQKAGIVVMTVLKIYTVRRPSCSFHVALCDPNTQELKYADDGFPSIEAAAFYKESLVSIKRKVLPVG